MRIHRFYRIERRAFDAEQRMLNAKQHRTDDAHIFKLRQVIVVFVHRTRKRIFDRHHAVIRFSTCDLLKNFAERIDRKRSRFSVEITRYRLLRIGAPLSAERAYDAFVRFFLPGLFALFFRVPYTHERFSDDGRKRFYVAHEFIELFGIQRLRSVGKRFIGIAVHFHDDPVGSRGDGCKGHGRHFIADAEGMARIDDDRKMRHTPQNGDRRKIERIARRPLVRADTAFAQNHVFAARRKEVFRGHKPLFDRR